MVWGLQVDIAKAQMGRLLLKLPRLLLQEALPASPSTPQHACLQTPISGKASCYLILVDPDQFAVTGVSQTPELTSPLKEKVLMDIFSCICRVTGPGGRETYGTAVRITPEGLYCTCTHVVTEDGEFLQVYIHGENLRLAVSLHFHDLAFVKGRVL